MIYYVITANSSGAQLDSEIKSAVNAAGAHCNTSFPYEYTDNDGDTFNRDTGFQPLVCTVAQDDGVGYRLWVAIERSGAIEHSTSALLYGKYEIQTTTSTAAPTTTTTAAPTTTSTAAPTTTSTEDISTTSTEAVSTTSSIVTESESSEDTIMVAIGMYAGIGIGALLLICLSYLCFCSTKREKKTIHTPRKKGSFDGVSNLWATHNSDNDVLAAPYEL